MTGTKRLVYAYPTSPSADEYNAGKGCWIVFIDSTISRVFQDSERWEALNHFESFDLPYSKAESFDRNSTPFTAQ